MKKTLLLSALLLAGTSFSQTLDFNNSGAGTGPDMGILFMNQAIGGGAGYEVPKGTGQKAIFAASLWCAAVDDTGGLHVAAMRFGQEGNDFFAGPYSTTNSYSDSAYLANYSQGKWYMTRGMIQTHINSYAQPGYSTPQMILDWPANGISGAGVAQNLAPFVDNNNNGIYEPALGEYPDIRGDAAYYMIMNDAAAPHTETGGVPLGIEIHTMLYQYATSDYLDKTTFLNYRVFNRGTNNYANFQVSLWSDFDLGNGTDDYIGCDVTNDLMYIYNADNDDEGFGAYGVNPPAVGISSLNKSMEYFTFFTNGAPFPYTDPAYASQYANFMQGLWANGSQMYFGGTGSTGTIPAKYMFPGDSDPTHSGTGGVNPGGAPWTEITANSPAGDRRGVMTVEDVVLNAGDEECYDFAVLYARELGDNNLQNLTNLRNQAATAKLDYDSGYNGTVLYNCDQITLGIEQLDETQIGLYPNPISGEFTLSFGDEVVSGTIIVTDLKGSVLYQEEIENENVKKIKLDTKNGVYNVSIITDAKIIHKRLIKAE